MLTIHTVWAATALRNVDSSESSRFAFSTVALEYGTTDLPIIRRHSTTLNAQERICSRSWV